MSSSQPRYARIWRGRTKKEKADAYQCYWLATGIDPLIGKGALSVEMLRDDGETEVEFVTISYWDSIEKMAPDGGDPHLTHHLPEDEDYLIEIPERVQILRILESRSRMG
ncbi:hypothetical protein [Terrarubrum flagellatum]|uniref:hypothetical protein n=1 Tax=Terrirubrum flagellatum TaxID=2895980 RepID=UPI0031451676